MAFFWQPTYVCQPSARFRASPRPQSASDAPSTEGVRPVNSAHGTRAASDARYPPATRSRTRAFQVGEAVTKIRNDRCAVKAQVPIRGEEHLARHACLTRAILARRGPRRAGPAPSQGRARSRRREGTRRRASARTRGYAESGEITPRLPNLTVAPKRMRSGRGSLGSRSTRRAGCPGRIPRALRDERPPRDPREARRRT